MKVNLEEILNSSYGLDAGSQQLVLEAATVKNTGGMVSQYFGDKRTISQVKTVLRQNRMSSPDIKQVVKLVRNEMSLNNRIERMLTMQQLFKYWHVAHLPFALIMLIIMVIHVGVTLAIGYRWIF